MNNSDEYLNHLIHMAQDLTRELAEVERRINEHTLHLDGECVSMKGSHGSTPDAVASRITLTCKAATP